MDDTDSEVPGSATFNRDVIRAWAADCLSENTMRLAPLRPTQNACQSKRQSQDASFPSLRQIDHTPAGSISTPRQPQRFFLLRVPVIVSVNGFLAGLLLLVFAFRVVNVPIPEHEGASSASNAAKQTRTSNNQPMPPMSLLQQILQGFAIFVSIVAAAFSCFGLLVSIIGWFVVHRLTVQREVARERREAKREIKTKMRAFLSFLAARKQEIGSERYHKQPEAFGPRYAEIQVELREQAALIERDVPDNDKRKFGQLIDAIVGKPTGTAATHDGIKYMLGIIDETEEFIRPLV